MNNIFEGAKFGDKFLTRGNRAMLYIGFSRIDYDKIYVLIDENGDKHQYTNSDGSFFKENVKSDWDIVSKYIEDDKHQEPIDEKKLDELAKDYVKQEEQYIRSVNDKVWNAYIHGYRKAMEE